MCAAAVAFLRRTDYRGIRMDKTMVEENAMMDEDKRMDAKAASMDPAVDAGTEETDLSVEEAFAQLEGLVSRMEEDGISLEESFSCYEKGIRLIRYCTDRIDRVEKKVQILRGEGGSSEEFS